MAGQLSLSWIEIIVLMMGAIILGITIHFFIVSRRTLNASIDESPGGRMSKEFSDWKLKYFNDIEEKEKEINQLKMQLAEAEESCSIYSIEAEEKGIKNKKLQAELDALSKQKPAGDKTDISSQLQQAQISLLDYNEKINQLLGKIDIERNAETRLQEMQKTNEELSREVNELKSKLKQKEIAISDMRQKGTLVTEVTSLVENAQHEFKVLLGKIRELENQVSDSKTTQLEYEKIKESYTRLSRDADEQKLKYNILLAENRQLKADLSQLEEKIQDPGIQRQPLQKNMPLPDELNQYMQMVKEAQKKLETQLNRIGEIESLLNTEREEKNDLSGTT